MIFSLIFDSFSLRALSPNKVSSAKPIIITRRNNNNSSSNSKNVNTPVPTPLLDRRNYIDGDLASASGCRNEISSSSSRPIGPDNENAMNVTVPNVLSAAPDRKSTRLNSSHRR